ARITPEQLKSKLDGGEKVLIIDLRSSAELKETGKLPGAIWFDLKTIGDAQVPRDRDVVLYCSCPNEAAAAKAALLLRARGITRVRPLEGGYDAWRERDYPLDLPASAVTTPVKPSL
ncbi:MAG: rhodanese-like domain-containing protein, partial [Bryobacteraceae bacterium]